MCLSWGFLTGCRQVCLELFGDGPHSIHCVYERVFRFPRVLGLYITDRDINTHRFGDAVSWKDDSINSMHDTNWKKVQQSSFTYKFADLCAVLPAYPIQGQASIRLLVLHNGLHLVLRRILMDTRIDIYARIRVQRPPLSHSDDSCWLWCALDALTAYRHGCSSPRSIAVLSIHNK